MSTVGGTATVVALAPSVAVDLATAWIAHRAENSGIRILVVKGPISAKQGLREARVSSDVDVLVEPARVDEFIAQVKVGGWKERFKPAIPWLMELHSTALIHENWPIDIDVHHYWPGFIADRTEVFEHLWSARSNHLIAGTPVFAPAIPDAVLILALHALRRPSEEGRVEEIPELVSAVERLGLSSSAIRDSAAHLGAVQTARPFLLACGEVVVPEANPSDELRLWQLNTGAKGHTRAWAVALASASWRDRPALLWRAAFPSPSELRGLHPELGPGVRGLTRGWMRRLVNGMKELPRALRDVSWTSQTNTPRPNRPKR